MILFLEDWKKYPSAIPDLDTKNVSFVRLAGLYKSMGIKNHLFPLALINPELKGVDPFDPNLDMVTMGMIAQECKLNPWYYFREIVRVPATGSPEPIYLEGNRGNIALFWLFFNHITVMLIQCRQTGKSLSSDTLANYIRCIGSVNTDTQLLTKDDSLRVKNIQRLKELQSALPHYLNLKSRQDADNNEKMTCVKLKNTYYTAVGQPTIEGARKVGRGMTLAINFIDEIAYIANIKLILPAMLAGSGAARENARRMGGLYGNVFTTTAGYLSSASGKFVYDRIYKTSFRWTEKLFDCENLEEAEEMIKKNTPRGELQVLCEFNHRQLGKTDEWLRERINAALAEGEDAAADFLNIWPQGSEVSPLDQETLAKINASRIGDPYTEISKQGYVTNWYVPERELENNLKNRKLVIGMDTSEAIGNDDITKIILDVETGEVVGSGIYNETNIITFSEWLADFLIKYPTTTLVIEKRSTGITIVDNLILILRAKGIDPFKRIFNWCVNDAGENKQYWEDVVNRDFYLRDDETYVKYRKHFGYATAGVGRASRDNLYGSCFKSSMKYLASVIRDRTLAAQLQSLVYRNGRIDHAVGEHDDAVIAFLLAFWFLTNGKNLEFYGINTRNVLKTINNTIIEEQGGKEAVLEKQRQNNIKEQIENLIEEIKKEKAPHKVHTLTLKIKHLYEDMGESNDPNFNIQNLLEDIKIYRNNNVRNRFSRMNTYY